MYEVDARDRVVELEDVPQSSPESDALLRALAALKERLDINVFRDGNVDVHHFDLYSQAALYDTIEPQLYRYPAIDPSAFRRKVRDALGDGA